MPHPATAGASPASSPAPAWRIPRRRRSGLKPSPLEWATITNVVGELDADLRSAHRSLQGLVTLLAGADPAHAVKPNDLHALLQPIAGFVGQAFHALVVLQVENLPDTPPD